MLSSPSQHRIIKPPRLRAGDVIGVVSPAGALSGERLIRLDRGLDYLRRKGYTIVEGRYVREQTGYLAGADEMRANDFNDMLRRPDIKAVFCSRGGYGVTRILDKIDYTAAGEHPKIVLGYSDITALQMALYNKAHLVSFSGPMVAIELGAELPPLTENSLWDMLTNDALHVLSGENPENDLRTISSGVAEGRLLGGCLSVVVSLLGTPWRPDFRNAILLLEDIGEDLYKIDRYFSQLKNAGILDLVNGVVLGRFIDIAADENNNPFVFDDLIAHYLAPLHIPVLLNFPYGHTPLKYTLPLGCRVRLDADRGALHLLESAVQ